MKVRFIGKPDWVTRDLTVGNVYEATPIARGAVDPYGLTVPYDDGIVIESDNVGDKVATYLSYGFEVVEG